MRSLLLNLYQRIRYLTSLFDNAKEEGGGVEKPYEHRGQAREHAA